MNPLFSKLTTFVQKIIHPGKTIADLQTALVSFDPALSSTPYEERKLNGSIKLDGLDPVAVLVALRENASFSDEEKTDYSVSYEDAQTFLRGAQIIDGHAKISFERKYEGKSLGISFHGSKENPHRLCMISGGLTYEGYNKNSIGLFQRVIESVISQQQEINQKLDG